MRYKNELYQTTNTAIAVILIILTFIIIIWNYNNQTVYDFDYTITIDTSKDYDYLQLHWQLTSQTINILDVDDVVLKSGVESYLIHSERHQEYEAVKLSITIRYYKYDGGDYAILSETETYQLHLIPVTDIEGL